MTTGCALGSARTSVCLGPERPLSGETHHAIPRPARAATSALGFPTARPDQARASTPRTTAAGRHPSSHDATLEAAQDRRDLAEDRRVVAVDGFEGGVVGEEPGMAVGALESLD